MEWLFHFFSFPLPNPHLPVSAGTEITHTTQLLGFSTSFREDYCHCAINFTRTRIFFFSTDVSTKPKIAPDTHSRGFISVCGWNERDSLGLQPGLMVLPVLTAWHTLTEDVCFGIGADTLRGRACILMLP